MECNILEKKQNIYGFKRIMAELKKIDFNFRERVKGLNCLFGISQLVEKPEVSFEEIICGTLELIPPAWQFPEVTCARITYDKKLYETENFKETEWKLTTRVEVNEKPMEIEVHYLENNPLLKEEVNLLKNIGKRLKNILEHMEAEQKLKETEEKLIRDITEIKKTERQSKESKEKLSYVKNNISIILGLVFSALYLLIEGLLDNYVFFNTEFLFQDIFTTDPHEILVHLIPISLMVFASIFSQHLINAQRKTEDKLKESKEELKKLNLELEQRIEERTKDLKKSEQKYRELYEDAPNAYFTIKPDKSIKSCNQAAVELLGYYKEEFQNIKFFDLYYNSPEDLQKPKRLFKQFLEGKNIQDVEIQMKHKNGNPIWVSLTVKPVRNQKGQVVESQSMVINITERKKTEELIIEENKKLAELNKIKKNLITRVSHELKTPLNSIYGAIHILMNFYRDRIDKEILEFNNIIYKGCIRLKKLIEDLMDISKLDHGKITLKKKKENIINTLMSCVSEINHMATRRNLNINIDLPKVLFVDFDKIRIEQVFINILSNAIKFTPPNGSIFIYLKEKYKNIEISVKDTGIGLTKDEMKHLFKQFGKIERYGEQMEVDIEGSGLGLYIAKQIIELHSGDIIVESEGRNKGSTFTIRLNK